MEKGVENPYSCMVLAGARSMDQRRDALQVRPPALACPPVLVCRSSYRDAQTALQGGTRQAALEDQDLSFLGVPSSSRAGKHLLIIIIIIMYQNPYIWAMTSLDMAMLGTILVAMQQLTTVPPNSDAAGQDILQGSTFCNDFNTVGSAKAHHRTTLQQCSRSRCSAG